MRRALVVLTLLSLACSEAPPPADLQSMQANLTESRDALRGGDEAVAIERALEAIALAPAEVDGYVWLSGLYARDGDHDRALETFVSLAEMHPHALRFLARHRALAGDIDQAVADLDTCILRARDHAGCRLERALLRQSRGEFEGAAEDFAIAYEAEPDPQTAARYAEVLRVSGAYERSREVVESGLAAAPDDPGLQLARARLLLRDGADGEAEAALRGILQRDGRIAAAHRQLGTLLTRTGREAEGAHHLARADLFRDYEISRTALVQQYSRSGGGRPALLMAELEMTVGNFANARQWLETARRAEAPAERLASTGAWIAYVTGDIPAGDAMLGQADDARAQLSRAVRAVRVGDADEARRRLAAALADPPNERAFLRRAADLHTALGNPGEAERLRARAATGEFP